VSTQNTRALNKYNLLSYYALNLIVLFLYFKIDFEQANTGSIHSCRLSF